MKVTPDSTQDGDFETDDTITVESGAQPLETVTLTETGTAGTFNGTITTEASVNNDNGKLTVADGDSVKVLFWDNSNSKLTSVSQTSVDTAGPTVGTFSPSSGSTLTDNQTTITVPVSDDDVDLDFQSFDVDINSGGQNYGLSTNGISYNNTTEELTIDPSTDAVDDLPDGSSVDVSVTAKDELGNSGSGSATYTVDTTGPTFSSFNPNDGTAVTSTTYTISVDITDATDGTVSGSSIEASVDDNTYTTSTSGVSFDGTTLTIDPSGSGVAELPEDTVDVSVSAEDSLGNAGSTSWSFSVDSTKPTVQDIQVTDAPINYSDDNDGTDHVVTVIFSEEMDTSTKPQVGWDANNDGDLNDGSDVADIATAKAGVSNNGFGTNDGYADDAMSWKGIITDSDIPNSIDKTAGLVVTTAVDPAGNGINSSVDNGSLIVDNIEPSVSESLPTSEVSGSLNVTDQFSESTGDDLTWTYVYSTDGGTTWETISTPDDFDTTQFQDQDMIIKGTAVDELGNSDSAQNTISLDNNDPTISFVLSDGQAESGTFNLTEDVTISKGLGETVTVEITAEGDGTPSTPATFISATTDLTTEKAYDTMDLEDETVDFKVSVSDPDGSVTDTITLDIDDLTGTSLGVSESSGNVTVKVTPEAGASLTSIDAEVTPTSGNNYFDAPTKLNLSRSDFTEKQDAVGDNYYVTTLTGADLPDGEYEVTLSSVTDSNSRTESVGTTSSAVVIDNEKPKPIDAEIVAASSGSTTIAVQFSEAIDEQTVETGDFVLSSGESVASVVSRDASGSGDGKLKLTFSSNIQTGDSPTIDLTDASSGVDEEFGQTVDASTSGSATVATIELSLNEGWNMVSLPAASGTTPASDLGNNLVVWKYDESTDTWQSDDTSTDADGSMSLEGGEGYLVKASSSSTVDVNVDNIPDDKHGPTVQDTPRGWNLIGHYQEGSQGQPDVFSSMSNDAYTSNGAIVNSVYAQSGSASTIDQLSYTSHTSDLQPGQAYWVFLKDDTSYSEHAWP